MTDIEIIYGFYGLLLGLAVATITTNLADALKSRRQVKLGYVPILIGAYILLCVVEQWTAMAVLRDVFTFSPLMLVTMLSMALPYIFVGRAMMPESFAEVGEIETFYLENKTEILIALLIPPLAASAFNLFYFNDMFPAILIATAVFKAPLIVIFAWLLLTRNIRLHRAGYALACLHLGGTMILRTL